MKKIISMLFATILVLGFTSSANAAKTLEEENIGLVNLTDEKPLIHDWPEDEIGQPALRASLEDAQDFCVVLILCILLDKLSLRAHEHVNKEIERERILSAMSENQLQDPSEFKATVELNFG